MKRENLCIYIDLENIPKGINIQDIMNEIIIKYETKPNDNEPIYAFKIACGNSYSIEKYREDLKKLNFDIKETPHIAAKKNRADLIISLDAFEKIYLDRPSINQFIFMTSDSDFTVIMDILRRYGKKVILITTNKDAKRDIFTNCADEIYIFEKYINKTKTEIFDKETEINDKYNLNEVFKDFENDADENNLIETNITENSGSYDNCLETDDNLSNSITYYDDIVKHKLLTVLKALDADKDYINSLIGSKYMQIDKTFDIRNSSFKKYSRLIKYFADKGYVRLFDDSEKRTRWLRINASIIR